MSAGLLPLAAVLGAVGLLGYLAAPYVLGRGDWRLRRPQLCLTLWFVCFGAGTASALTGVGLVVVVGAGAGRAAGDDPAGAGAANLMAWVALAVGGGAFSLVATQLGAMVVTERRLRADFDRLTASAACRRRAIAGLRVWVVDGAGATVIGLRGRRHGVLVSREVVEAITPTELHAVLEHERAHLRGGHDLLSRLAVLQLGCLPGRLTSEAMAGSTALLIELAADRAAARRVGVAPTVSALRRLAELRGPSLEAETLRLRARLLVA